MSQSSQISKRKSQHIDAVLNQNVQAVRNSLANFKLPYKALPEINLAEVDTSIEFLDKKLSMPFIVSSMTGGPEKAEGINRNLAIASEEAKVALALGSMRIILKYPETGKSFDVKHLCPNIPLLGNIGLVQLNYGVTVDDINRLIDDYKLDGICLHINPLQEAIQPEGDTNFEGLIEKLSKIINQIHGHVIVKEVGTGIDLSTALKLRSAGAKWIDVSGMGGTSWTLVEGHRRQDDLGEIFRNEGLTTVESLTLLKDVEGLSLIAGGGIRTGLDIAKSLILGAKVATAGTPLLGPALNSPEECIKVLKQIKKELEIAMFICSAQSLEEMHKLSLINI